MQSGVHSRQQSKVSTESLAEACAAAPQRSALDSRLSTDSECAHCSLPLGRRPVAATIDGARARFCCYGCVLAQQVTRARGESGAAAAILVRLGLAVFFAMNAMMVSLPTYVPYVYGDGASSDGPLFQVLRVLALVFAAPVIGLLGWPILMGAIQGLRSGGANTDALIVLGTVAAYALSAANVIAGRGAVYFDTAAMLLVFVTLGRYLEARAKAEAGSAVRATLAPGPLLATRVRNGASESVAPDVLAPNDIVRVGPGDAFPTDGVVAGGCGGVDEAALTGESRPILKEPGSLVASGTCSVDGLFLVRVTLPASQSAAARVAALLDRARRERAPAERVADRVAAVLVPVVIGIAAAAGLFWARHRGIDHGVLVALAVLVVACPCGLGIATPVAVWTGLVTAARHGVIVRSGAALERVAAVERVLFDKTGTLTERTPRLVAIEPTAESMLGEQELLARAVALESGQTHPLARAITAVGARHAVPLPRAVEVLPGRGVRGLINGTSTAVGSLRFAAEELGDSEPRLQRYAGIEGSVVLIWSFGHLLGALRFAEQARPEAAAALHALAAMHVGAGLVSGDRQAHAVVPALIPAESAALGLLPEEKVARIRALRTHPIAMVGDGVNDAPALAAAAVGIAVGSATDLTRMTADVAIVSDDLRHVPWLIAHARGVVRVIRQNLFWAFAYNAGAVALAAAGALNPLVASLAMIASSLVVVANARRLGAG